MANEKAKPLVISEKFVERTKPSDRRQQFFDSTVTGFGVRIEPNGKRYFIFRAKINGTEVFRALGEWPATSVKVARDAAKKLAGDIATWKRDGCPEPNPFAKTKKESQATAPLFKELLEAYIARHIQKESLNPRRAEYDTRNLVKNHLQSILDLAVDQVTVDHVLAAKNACKGLYMQNSIVELVSRVYNWSAGARDGKLNFWKCENPAAGIGRNKPEARRRFLSDNDAGEFGRFFAELAKEPHVDTRDILTLLLSTGARKSNVYAMAWADVHLDRQVWEIPMSKNGSGYTVPLSEKVVEILERRRESADEGERFVFPADSRSGHVSDIKKRWAAFRMRAGIGDVRLHDLRRTRGSLAALAGQSLQKIGGMLGHKSLAATAIYARLNPESIREAAEAGDAMMNTIMERARKRPPKTQKLLPAAKVVSMVSR